MPCRQVAVVLVAQLHGIGQAGLPHALLSPGQLLARQRHARDPGAELLRRRLGQPAPAAADLQQALAGLQPHLVQRAPELGLLGVLQVGVAQRFTRAPLEPGGAVAHAGVQPQAVEIVAQVVVGMDVPGAAGPRIALQQVAQAVAQPAPPAAVHQALHMVAVGHAQAQQGGQVGAVPLAGDIAFGQPDVARFERALQRLPVVQHAMRIGSPDGGRGRCSRRPSGCSRSSCPWGRRSSRFSTRRARAGVRRGAAAEGLSRGRR